MLALFTVPVIAIGNKLHYNLEITVEFTTSFEAASEAGPESDNLEIQELYCALPGHDHNTTIFQQRLNGAQLDIMFEAIDSRIEAAREPDDSEPCAP